MNDWTLYLACKRLTEYDREERQPPSKKEAKKLCSFIIDLNEILTINTTKR